MSPKADKPSASSEKQMSIAELAEIHKEDIARIEKLDCHVQDRIQILLVLLELKPVVTFALDVRESAENIAKVVRDAGLIVEIEKKGHYRSLIIARSPENINKIIELHAEQKRGLSEDYHQRYGRLVGYPQTAIDAFSGRIPALTEEESYHLDPDLIFSVVFSKDHWKEELEVMRKWSQAIKQYAPHVYAEEQEKRKR